MAGSKSGEMFFTLEMRDNINKRGTEVIRLMGEMQGSIDKVTQKLVELYTVTDKYGNETLSKEFNQQIKASKDYIKSIGEIRNQVSQLWSMYRTKQKMNLDTADVENNLRILFDMLKQLRTGAISIDSVNTQIKNAWHKYRDETSSTFRSSAIKEYLEALFTIRKEIKTMSGETASPAFIEVWKAGFTEVLEMVKKNKTEIKRTINEAMGLQQKMQELQRIKDKSAAAHGEFTQMQWDAKESAAQEKHMRDLEKLRQAMIRRSEEEAAAYQRNTERQRQNNQARQESTRALRQQIEETVRSRLEMLRAQQEQLRSGITKNKGILDPDALKQAKQALTEVSREIMTLETVVKRMGSYSTVALGGFVNGNNTGVAPQVQQMNQAVKKSLAEIEQKQKQAAEAARVLSQRQKEAAESARILQVANNSMSASYSKVTQSMRQNMSTLSMLRQQMGYYFSIFGAQTLLQNVIKIGGQFEYQHVALQNIIGDAEKASVIFGQLKDLAIESPKTFLELTTAAKQLSAYQTPVDELYDTTRRLSDLSVGLGVDINRLILAFGQVRAAAVLRGQELRQFTEAGIPIVQALADKFTEMNGQLTTTGDVFKLISKRAVSFEMVRDILWEMTNEGGRFYNMQAEMADTLYGKWQKLADIWQITLGDMANFSVSGFKPFHALVESMVFAARNLSTLVPLLISFAGARGLDSLSRSTSLFGMGGINKNIEQAQKLQRIELMRLRLNNEISAAEYAQRMQLNNQRSYYYQILAAEGKISDRKLAQLAIDNKMNKMFAYRLLLMKGYTKEQIRQAMGGNLGVLRGSFSGFGSSLMNFLGGPTGVLLMAIGGVVAAWSAYSRRMDEIKEKTDNMVNSANDKVKELNETLAAIPSPKSLDDSEMKHQIQAMKQVLREQDLYTKSIDESVKSASTLVEKYEILREAIKKARDEQENKADVGQIVEDAIKASGYWFNPFDTRGTGLLVPFANDYIDENIEQLQESINKYKTTLSAFGDYRENIEREIRGVGPSLWYSLGLNGKDLEDQISILIENNMWDKLVEKARESDEELADNMEKIGERVLDINKKWKEIDTDDIPRIVDSIKEHLPVSGSEEIAKWAKSNEEIVNGMINGIVSALNIQTPSIATKLTNAIRKLFSLPEVVQEEVVPKTVEELQSANNEAMFARIKKMYGEGVTTIEELAKWTGDVENEKSLTDAYDAIIKAKKEKEENLNAAKALSDDYLKEQAEFDRMNKIYKGSGAEAYEASKSSSSSTTDKELQKWKERFSELKSFYSEYKKWAELVGKDKALEKLQESGSFSSLFSGGEPIYDISDWEKALKKFYSELKGGTLDWEKLKNDVNSEIRLFNYDQEKENAEEYVQLMKDTVKDLGEQWDLYKKIYESTGDKAMASNVAFGGITSFKNYVDQLRSKLSDSLKKNNISISIDELLGMSDKQLSNIGITKYSEAYQLIRSIEEEGQKLSSQQADYWLEAYKSAHEYDLELGLIKSKYDRLREAAEANRFVAGNQTTDSILQGLDNAEAKEIADLTWKNFKETEEWGRVFADLDNMSTSTLQSMLSKLRELAPDIDVSVESTKALYEAIENIQEVLQDRNPFQAMSDSLAKMNSYRSALSFIRGNLGITNRSETVRLDKETAKKYRLGDGSKEWTGTIQQLMDMIKESESDFSDSVGSMADKFKAVEDVLQPVIDLFDILGNEDLSNFFTMGSNALGAASQAASGLNSLGLGSMGPYGAAAAAALSVASQIFSMHDKSLQKEIDASEARQKEMENLTKNLKNALERSLEGIFDLSASYEDIRNLEDVIGKQSYNIGLAKIGYTSEDTKRALSNAKKSRTYYDYTYASLLAQRDELQHQYDLEDKKKKSDSEKLNDYKQQLVEMSEQVRYFAQEMAKEIYDIDFKSWAEELSSALVSAWENGESAIDAYKEKVGDILKDLGVKMITERFVSRALEPIMEDFINQYEIDKGVLTEDGMRILAGMYNGGEKLAKQTSDFLDGLNSIVNESGADLKDLSTKTSGLSKSIQGTTEETSNLLASYLNAVRADVSVIRSILQGGAPEDNNIVVESQLRQLEMIASNTSRNADAAERIESMFNAVIIGTKKIYIN